MKTDYLTLTLVCSGVLFGIFGLTQAAPKKSGDRPSPAAKADPVERGRYLVRTSGCNDCHTPRFMELGDKVPESDWLTGSPIGWRGPWGTSYATNLRRHIAAYADPDLWIKMVRSRNGLPPMPWPSLHAMTDGDLRAVHAYISSLEVKGDTMPPPVPRDKEPDTPYLNLAPVMPKSKTEAASAAGSPASAAKEPSPARQESSAKGTFAPEKSPAAKKR